MKKLGKRLSYLTKVMLVIGLLISNLSPLSIVFASELVGNVELGLVDSDNDNNKDSLEVKYLGELAEDLEKVNIKVEENYTYLDNTRYADENIIKEYNDVLVQEFVSEGMQHTSILNGTDPEKLEEIEVFDGLYEAKVIITNVNDVENLEDDEVIGEATYSEIIAHRSGLDVKLFDTTTNEEIVLKDGKYPLTMENARVKTVAKVLSGGMNPSDEFVCNLEGVENKCSAMDLLNLEFGNETDFTGYLFGEYTLPVVVKLEKYNNEVVEEVEFAKNIDVLYESYEMNTLLLNMGLQVLELDKSYEFYGNSENGNLYVLLNKDKVNTMLDLYNLMSLVLESEEGQEDVISYLLSNSEYEDVIGSYNEEGTELTLEEYLTSILLDDTAVLTLMNDGLTVTYKVLVTGDMDNDNALTEEDLLKLINQVIEMDEVSNKADVYEDEEVNVLDVMYLDQVIRNDNWELELSKMNTTIDSRLDVIDEDIVSGEEFIVNYVVSIKDYSMNGLSGLFKYDETMLELVSINTYNEWLGNNHNGRFLYLGNESLTGDVMLDENGEEVVTNKDYVMVSATFRALKSGTSTVSIENLEYFNQDTYLVNENNVVSKEVVVNASNDNSLSSLVVAGQEIELVEDVLDYEIKVSNETTEISVEAITNNIAANITSIVYPEKLVEGENVVTVTVMSENGDEKVYTITVIREEAPKEEETPTTPIDYNNYEEDNNDKEEEVNTPLDKDDEEIDEDDDEEVLEEDSNLSRIVIIILILLVIAGLVYLIFKDDDDEETRKTNREINKLKKTEVMPEVKVTKKNEDKPISKPVNKTSNSSEKKSTNKANGKSSSVKNKNSKK